VFATDVGTPCAVGRPGVSTFHVPPVLSIAEKPVVVRKPPGTPPGWDVWKSALTLVVPFVVRAAIAFSFERIEWQSAVQPPPWWTKVSSCAYVFVPRFVGSLSEYE
jgi:hypothetical protein